MRFSGNALFVNALFVDPPCGARIYFFNLKSRMRTSSRISRTKRPGPARPTAPKAGPPRAPLEIFDAVGCFVLIEDASHTILYNNARLRGRYGDLVGRKCYAAIAGRTSSCPSCPITAILHEGKESFSCVMRDQKGRLYESSASPFLMPDGGRAVIQLLTDITAKRKAQAVISEYTTGLKTLVAEKTAELKESEILHRLLMERANDAIFTIDPQADRILTANRMAETMTGYSAEELLGLKNSELYAPGEFAGILRRLGDDEGSSRASAQIEMLRKTGAHFVADVSASAVDFRGRRIVLAICRDISQRLIIERHMRQLASVIENTSASVMIMDLNRRIVYANPAVQKMLGYRAEEMLGMRSADFFEGVPGNPPDLSGRIAREARNGLWEGEIFDRRKSGEVFPVSLRMCTIRDETGKLIGYAGISEEITRRKQIEEELIQKEKLSALGELISGIAHELNNPLTGVLWYAEILRQHDAPAELKEDIDRLHKEALRCQYLVRNLLTFSRKPPLRRVCASVNEIVGLAIDLKAHQFIANGIRVQTRLDPSIRKGMLDSNQLQQVFVNILTNAHHALMEKDGERLITVTSRHQNGAAEIAIANNGPHIPPDRIEKIFVPYFSTKEFGQGTGLGLSIAHGIVREHGGKIEVMSLEGRDTVFTVILPLIKPAEE